MSGERISVVIPSYRNPSYLDLCLRSATENQVNKLNQIIVVLDGFAEESQHIIEKYPGIEVVAFEENKGQMIAHNTGVMLAENEMILIVNDDNVFPREWDKSLVYAGTSNFNVVWAPNQIEPTPSIFKSFVHKDFGKTPEEFQYNEFLDFSSETSHQNLISGLGFSYDGQTWPLFIHKKWYMTLNGIDQNYPSPAVADWDFFLRCELAGLKCYRDMSTHFYHFAGAATRKIDAQWNEKESQSFEYFAHKWGYYPPMRADTHSHIESTLPIVRGVRFLEENNG